MPETGEKSTISNKPLTTRLEACRPQNGSDLAYVPVALLNETIEKLEIVCIPYDEFRSLMGIAARESYYFKDLAHLLKQEDRMYPYDRDGNDE